MPITFHRNRCLQLVCVAAAIIAFLVAFASSFTRAVAAAGPATHEMVVAESDVAAEAGLGVMKQGGNAIDAAVATSLMLGVTNASSCGIGGGGFMLIYIAKTQRFYALDYREVAPAAASEQMYFRNGVPHEELARKGALAVAVPGELAGLETALHRFGKMKFSALAAPAIKAARDGFAINPHVAQELQKFSAEIAADPGLRAIYFAADGKPLAANAITRNPKLASAMAALGNDPAKVFYHGAIGQAVIQFLASHGGIISAQDLASYRPVWREPLHLPYAGYDVYTMPPPSSGGVVLEMLGMLSGGNPAGLGADSAPYLARLIEVMRQGFLDRAQYADPAFVKVPITKLLSPQHIAEARDRAFHHKNAAPNAPSAHDHGTSNFCVVDRYGDVVDVTTTINTVFGAEITVPSLGLVLNDEMDDFSVAPGVPNAFHLVGEKSNAIAPGKRPLSSMSPTVVLKDHRPVLVTGGSGGPTIITGVAQVSLNVLDFRMTPEQAVSSPRIHEQAQPPTVFAERSLPTTTISELKQMGYPLKTVPELGAVNAISIAPGDLRGAFDPRKGGGVAGE
ncbi:MAG TPA: gamma-glutamyltransferase [Candidatus Binataceae bacterium]|nr:gamma-glutamyltransferase [Candidatus Binataceae bacterium]